MKSTIVCESAEGNTIIIVEYVRGASKMGDFAMKIECGVGIRVTFIGEMYGNNTKSRTSSNYDLVLVCGVAFLTKMPRFAFGMGL